MGKNKVGKLTYFSVARNMIQYYNNEIFGNKRSIQALDSYKLIGYSMINQLLLKKLVIDISLFDIIEAVKDNNKKTIDEKQVIATVIKGELARIKEHIQTIKVLDSIIINAPNFIVDTITVYRAMSGDIYDDLVCENKQYFYTCPTYMSTSLTPNVTDKFKGKDGTRYIIKLSPMAKCIFLPWQLKQNHDMGNVIVDDEFELLLLRGSKFLIESMSFEPEPIHKRKLLKYRDIPCYDHLPVFTKTYTMRLISQPSFEELKNGYAKIKKDVTFGLKFWNLSDIPLSDIEKLNSASQA